MSTIHQLVASTKDKKGVRRGIRIATVINAHYCLKKDCQKSVKPLHGAMVDVDSNKEMQ